MIQPHHTGSHLRHIGYPKNSWSGGMNKKRNLTLDWLLEDDPDEAIAYALADSLTQLDGHEGVLLYRLSQADKVRIRLRSLGFDIVRLL
jgi:hypothetical protein